jgi:hypothetical protein
MSGLKTESGYIWITNAIRQAQRLFTLFTIARGSLEASSRNKKNQPQQALRLVYIFLAEAVGFEPTRHFCPLVFKTSSIGRSDRPPRKSLAVIEKTQGPQVTSTLERHRLQ